MKPNLRQAVAGRDPLVVAQECCVRKRLVPAPEQPLDHRGWPSASGRVVATAEEAASIDDR